MTTENREIEAKETAIPEKSVDAMDVEVGVSQSHGKSCCSRTKGLFLYEVSREDIQAFYLNQFGRSTLFLSFMFLSLAILQLANEQAGCPKTESGGYENCGNTVYGMQPSSMLPLIAMVGGLATSAFMPYAGAVVDYSDNRLGFARAVAFVFVLVNFIQIFIYQSTWFFLSILQAVFGSACFFANAMVMWSYLEAPNDHQLHGITASGRIWETAGMLSMFIAAGVVQFVSGWDSVGVARFAQAYATLVGGVLLFIAHKKYKPVKAVQQLEPGRNLYVAGVMQLWSTLWDLGKTEPAAQRFLFALMFNAGANGSYTSIAITYLTQQIQMSSTEVVAFIVLNMAVNPVGGFTHRYVARRFGHKVSYVSVLCFLIASGTFFVGAIAGPDQKKLIWLISVLYGVGFGWYYPSSNGYFCSLVPEERISELWGFNMFASVILSWIPPLIFTSLNEATGNLRLGLVSLVVFLVIGCFIGLTIPPKAENTPVDTVKIEEMNSGATVNCSKTNGA